MSTVLLDRKLNRRENAPENEFLERLDRVCKYVISESWGVGDCCGAWERACKRFFGRDAIDNGLSGSVN